MKPTLIKLLLITGLTILCHGCSPYTEGEAIQTDLPDKYAFLVLDIQNDFMLPNGKLPIDTAQSSTVTRTVNMLLPFFKENQVEIIYISNEFEKSDTIANWFRNNAAIKGTEGAQFAEDLLIITSNHFIKNSADAFSNSEFDKFLRKMEITKLIISGVFADQCVLSTVKGGLNRGYEFYVVSDAIGAKSEKNLSKALRAYNKLNVNIVTSEQMVNKIKL